MNINFDLRYVSAITLITSLLLTVNPTAIGAVGTFVVESVHFITLCLYAVLAVGFTSLMLNKDKLMQTYLEQHKDKVTYDSKNPMDSKAFSSLVTIVAINLVVVGVAIYSGWWITTVLVTWAVMTTISSFLFISKIKKKEVK